MDGNVQAKREEDEDVEDEISFMEIYFFFMIVMGFDATVINACL